MELWKDIPGYEGLYQASSLGRIKSVERVIERTGQGPKKVKEIFLSQKKFGGYYRVNLHKNGKQKTFLVHRLVAICFLNNPNNYQIVNHIDGNKLNNIVDNLEFCTSEMNNAHVYKNGLRANNTEGLKKSNEEHSAKIVCLKKNIVIYTGENSRDVANWLIQNHYFDKNIENLARAIRKHSLDECLYHGIQFKRLNVVQNVNEKEGILNIIENNKIIHSCATSNEAAMWLINTQKITNAKQRTVARTIRKVINTKTTYHNFYFIKTI